MHIVADRLGIAKALFARKPDQLSAGQKQVVGIGRALTIPPRVLLLDEPLAHVDPQRRLNLRCELKAYHDTVETITLYVSHNLAEAFSMADRVAIMNAGKLVQVGTPEYIRSHPASDFVRDFLECFEMQRISNAECGMGSCECRVISDKNECRITTDDGPRTTPNQQPTTNH